MPAEEEAEVVAVAVAMEEDLDTAPAMVVDMLMVVVHMPEEEEEGVAAEAEELEATVKDPEAAMALALVTAMLEDHMVDTPAAEAAVEVAVDLTVEVALAMDPVVVPDMVLPTVAMLKLVVVVAAAEVALVDTGLVPAPATDMAVVDTTEGVSRPDFITQYIPHLYPCTHLCFDSLWSINFVSFHKYVRVNKTHTLY
jgi:hypothetical protein